VCMVVNTVVNDVVQVSGARFCIKEMELSIQDGSVILWSGIQVHKLVTTKLIELIVMRIGSKLLESIDPVLVINQGFVIIRRGIPVEVTGKCDMGKGVPFFVSVRLHQNVGKAIANFNQNDVSVGSNHGLKTTKRAVSLTDPDTKHFTLCRCKNRATTTMVCPLVHDGDDRSSVGFGDTASHADLLVVNLVMIKANDINASSCEGIDTDIITNGTSINKSTVIVLTLLVVGNVARAFVRLAGTDRWRAIRGAFRAVGGAFAHRDMPLDGVGITLC